MVTMSAVWDRTTEFLSDNVGAVVTIAALTWFVPGAIQGAIEPLQATAGPGAKLGLSVLFLIFSLVSLFGQAALIALAIDPATGWRGAFATGAARFPAMIGISIVLMALVLLLVLPPVILLAAGGADFADMTPGWAANLSPATLLIAGLYGLALLPVLVWLFARLSVVSGVVVAERLGLGAIRRGWALTRGLAPRIAGAVILLVIVGGVAILAAETVFGSVFRIAFGNAGTVNAATVLTAIVVSLVSTALGVVLTAFLAKLYLAARARAEAAVPA